MCVIFHIYIYIYIIYYNYTHRCPLLFESSFFSMQCFMSQNKVKKQLTLIYMEKYLSVPRPPK